MFGDNAVRLAVGCGAVSRRMQFTWPILGLRRTKFRDLLESMLLLNRKEFEDVFYMKMERLDDTYPTVYQFP